MFLYQNFYISIFFGDSSTSISLEHHTLDISSEVIDKVAEHMHVNRTAFLRQTHSSSGISILEHDENIYYFNYEGDYILTEQKSYGIGVLTADCLPLVFYDPVTKSVGIVHAGWKGLVRKIIHNVICDMIEKHKVNVLDLELYIGPAAGLCCYEVKQDFVSHFLEYEEYFDLFFIEKNGKTYFDSRVFVIVLVRNLGMNAEKIYTRYNVCTICNSAYCSYRREKGKARRQISMVCLH